MLCQKIIFYFVTEQMLTFSTEYVALLSVFSSITLLLQIPLIAFSQANSLYISGNKNFSRLQFYQNIAYMLGIFMFTMGISYLAYPYLLQLLNVKNLSMPSEELFFTLCLFTFAQGYRV
ncbi:hypothetical protein C7N83_01615 [Neisseria iguanae]|uniref:Polysaccharide biosynthesis protein n=1 Tax=Neisseria iguanae TaxID=90242 RepID=A0A2P7U2T8_9NEIS|nr:hypothetical protein C7N83_01615 [Neisseria iguanae]